MNLNDFAKEVTEEEGLKQSLSIAQVKEVIRIVLRRVKAMEFGELITLLARVK